MPKQPKQPVDLDSAVAAVVVSEVQAALEPYLALFDRLAILLQPSGHRPPAAAPVAIESELPAAYAPEVEPSAAASEAVAAPIAGPVIRRYPARRRRLAVSVNLIEVVEKPKPEAVKPVLRRKGLALAQAVVATAPGEPLSPAQTAASRFSEGQTVQFKTGDKLVDAKVISIDGDSGLLLLEQLDTHKLVKQPAGWVFAVEPQLAAAAVQ